MRIYYFGELISEVELPSRSKVAKTQKTDNTPFKINAFPGATWRQQTS